MQKLNLTLTIFLLISSCTIRPECTDPVSEDLVHDVFNQFLSMESLDQDAQPIIVPYSYRKPSFADGFLTPMPPGSKNISELDLLNYFRKSASGEKYFSVENDSKTIKNQILKGRDGIPQVFGDFKTGDHAIGIYTFYLPIFNCARDAVYISYVYQVNDVWEYTGAIVRKSTNEWKLVDRFH